MTVIFERNAEGVVKMGMMEIKIPSDKTALSMLNSANHFSDGDVADIDGWIYSDGVRTKKWFSMLDGGSRDVRVWEPKLRNLALCERSRWKANKYSKKFYDKAWPFIFETMKQVSPFCCYADNTYMSKGWIIIDASDRGVGWEWSQDEKGNSCLDKQPQNVPLNQEIGNLWFEYELRSKEVGFRSWIFEKAFRRALDFKFGSTFANNHELRAIHAIINGRDYWLRSPENRYSEYRVDIISYPEKTLRVEVVSE